MFSLKKFLVSECDFKLVCFCESCKEIRDMFQVIVFAEKSLKTDWYWYGLSSRYFDYNA